MLEIHKKAFKKEAWFLFFNIVDFWLLTIFEGGVFEKC